MSTLRLEAHKSTRVFSSSRDGCPSAELRLLGPFDFESPAETELPQTTVEPEGSTLPPSMLRQSSQSSASGRPGSSVRPQPPTPARSGPPQVNRAPSVFSPESFTVPQKKGFAAVIESTFGNGPSFNEPSASPTTSTPVSTAVLPQPEPTPPRRTASAADDPSSSQNPSLKSYFKHGPFINDGGALGAWRPKSLRETTFSAFAFVHVACIATLAGLFDYSRSHQGLLTVDTDLHYVWTYAPPLFFTVVGACWSRVAYRIHQMQPWRIIAERQKFPQEALLVEYVTPIALVSLFKAIRARHLLVVTVILASIALQLVTILSTGLFDVEYLQVRRNTALHRLDIITGLDHDFSIISGSPDLTIYSVQNTNLSYPEGTNADYAAPELSYKSAHNATLTAPVDVFAARLLCDSAKLEVQKLSHHGTMGGMHNAPQFTYSLSTDDCLVVDQKATGGHYLDYNYVGDNFVFYDTYGDTAAVTCSGENAQEQDIRIRISVGLIHYNITWNGTFEDWAQNKTVVLPSDLSKIYKLEASNNLLCVPEYGRLPAAEVTYSTNEATGRRQLHVQAPESDSLQPLEGVTSNALSNAIMDSIVVSSHVMSALYPDPNANAVISNDPSQSNGGFFPVNSDAFFSTLAQQYPLANGSDKSVWFDTDQLQSRSSQFFGSVATQFASQYLRKGISQNISGTVATIEPRLVLLPAVFYATEALLGFSTLAALMLARPASRSVTPVDPASIGGTTVILARRMEIQALREDTNTTDIDQKAQWWRPWVLKPFMREFVLLIPVIAIAAIETTLHYSKKHNGLTTIDRDHYKLYAARLVPALAFSGIRLLLSSLAFNVSLMSPVSKLRQGPSAAHVSLFDAESMVFWQEEANAQDMPAVKVHLISNSIVELNLSYPAWTYENLAFPQVALADLTTTNAINATSVSAKIPAVRTVLQCEVVQDGHLNISYTSVDDPDFSGMGQFYSHQYAIIKTIHNNILPGCDSALDFGIDLPHRLGTSEKGSIKPRPCASTTTIDDRCPYFVGIYGYATDEARVNQSVISCRASYEQIESTVTFDLPNYVFSKIAPPTVDETTAKPLHSTEIPVFLASVMWLDLYNTTETTLDGLQVIDTVTAALIYGKDGVPLEQIFQQPPEEHLIPNLKGLIGITGAQYMSYFYRTADPSVPLVDSTIPATLQMGPNYRLKQNATSTRILDALLAASILFAAITIFTFRYRDVAKTKLGSVGANWALVAESEFVHDLRTAFQNLREGHCEKNEPTQESADIRQMEQKLSSEGYQFSLGWWSDSRALPTTEATETHLLKPRRRWAIDVGRSEG
ncbi:hypothetical protein H2200_006523 [Cladophialophora chaetospira]|uniref:Uncharacterized protein n=1 Tax=Cladophialophora chaetospira TaxID=386627 RepID=A0AA38X8H6_9EURO|nr:hypothetical protein H2200_006523 [Cladophialophora chaetospira]